LHCINKTESVSSEDIYKQNVSLGAEN